jgi:hypothetical protein
MANPSIDDLLRADDRQHVAKILIRMRERRLVGPSRASD